MLAVLIFISPATVITGSSGVVGAEVETSGFGVLEGTGVVEDSETVVTGWPWDSSVTGTIGPRVITPPQFETRSRLAVRLKNARNLRLLLIASTL